MKKTIKRRERNHNRVHQRWELPKGVDRRVQERYEENLRGGYL